ncbi:MAG: hypothetical protein ACREIA_01680 [Opitutaceae bacterium]
MMFRLPALLALLSTAAVHAADDDALSLLNEAVKKWADEADHWSFVQHVREFRDGEVREERRERFDPSQPDSSRWELLEINGREPTDEELQDFDNRKNRKPRKRFEEPAEYIDFERVTISDETDDWIEFVVPLRGDLSLFIPFEDVAARVKVDRRTSAIRKINAGLLEEMRIFFGIARVTALEMEFTFHDTTAGGSNGPAELQPRGKATAAMYKWGRYAELRWSDFARVGDS